MITVVATSYLFAIVIVFFCSMVNEDSSSLFEKRNKEKKIGHPLYTKIETIFKKIEVIFKEIENCP